MRLYAIKHKTSELFISGVHWKNAHLKSKRVWEIVHRNVEHFMDADDLRYMMERIVYNKLQSKLDEYDLVSYDEQLPKKLTGGRKLSTVQKMVEAKVIMEALRS